MENIFHLNGDSLQNLTAFYCFSRYVGSVSNLNERRSCNLFLYCQMFVGIMSIYMHFHSCYTSCHKEWFIVLLKCKYVLTNKNKRKKKYFVNLLCHIQINEDRVFQNQFQYFKSIISNRITFFFHPLCI